MLIKLFEKPAFRWQEPKAFLRQKDAWEGTRRRWWHKPGAAGLCFLMLLGSWILASLTPGRNPPPFELVLPPAVGMAVLFAYGLPWLQTILLIPSEVRFFSPRIVRMHFGNQFWDYSKIHCFEWAPNPEYHMLLFKYGPKERIVSIGLPVEMDVEDVTRFLLSKGIEHSSSTAC